MKPCRANSTIFLIVVTAALAPTTHAAQFIPAARTFNSAWQSAGYPGEIPAPAKIANVRDFGAAGTGAANDYPAVAAAISSLSNAPGVVYFPAGTYLLQSTVNVPADVVMRGERSHNTTLRWNHLGSCINIAKSQSGVFQPVVSGYTIHSSSLGVSNGAVFAPGDYAEIREDNDPAWGASDWAPKVVGQILRITSVSGDTLTLEQPLRITYLAAQNPEIRKVTLITEAGVENLRVERLLAGTNAVQRDNIITINLQYAAHCWVRGVEGYNAFGGHVALTYTTASEVTGNYFHHAHEYDGGGSGYGARLEFKTGECLIENNIFRSLRHSMLVQAGVNGNVFSYNYSREPLRTEFPSEISSDVAGHGNYPFANLYEGNIVQHIWIDNSHNANGPLNTYFRNRAEAYGFNMTDPAGHSLNIVGNETYTGGWSILVGDGWALMGMNHFAHGNNTQSDGVQAAGTTNLTDYSYYLNSDPSVLPPLPSWWNIPNPFPAIGLPLSRTATKEIPARARYFSNFVFTVGPPSLAKQPTNLTVNAGQTAAFTVQAYGTPAARYAWQLNNVPLPDQTNATLTLSLAQPGDAGSYDVLISDDYGTVRSAAATLTVISTDTDGDGLPDAWELAMFGNLAQTGGGDFDGDGFTNLQEYLAGTNPTLPTDALAVTSITRSGNDLVLNFASVPGKAYVVERRDDLEGAPWGPITNFTASAATTKLTNTGGASPAQRFYHVRLAP